MWGMKFSASYPTAPKNCLKHFLISCSVHYVHIFFILQGRMLLYYSALECMKQSGISIWRFHFNWPNDLVNHAYDNFWGAKMNVNMPLHLIRHHTKKVYGEWMYSPINLKLLNTLRWVVSFMSWPHYCQGKWPWYPTDRRLGGSQMSLDVVEEKVSAPTGVKCHQTL